MPKAIYDGIEFVFDDIPSNMELTGDQLKERLGNRVGRRIEGATTVHRENGDMEYISADESVRLGPNDTVGVTAPFETAGRCFYLTF